MVIYLAFSCRSHRPFFPKNKSGQDPERTPRHIENLPLDAVGGAASKQKALGNSENLNVTAFLERNPCAQQDNNKCPSQQTTEPPSLTRIAIINEAALAHHPNHIIQNGDGRLKPSLHTIEENPQPLQGIRNHLPGQISSGRRAPNMQTEPPLGPDEKRLRDWCVTTVCGDDGPDDLVLGSGDELEEYLGLDRRAIVAEDQRGGGMGDFEPVGIYGIIAEAK